jgi:hypothetical protein
MCLYLERTSFIDGDSELHEYSVSATIVQLEWCSIDTAENGTHYTASARVKHRLPLVHSDGAYPPLQAGHSAVFLATFLQ